MLGTAGHVDHGKTALVRLLTGCETDRLAEEKRRGLTIELGFAPCKMADERIVGIVDVPGHVGFIKNMVAAAHGIDVVALVVAADDGVMPQTREHLDILTLMGTKCGLIALTKIDLVDEEMQQLVAEDLADFVSGTFLEGKPICPVSSITGEGFQGFYKSLNEEVDRAEAINTAGFFRQWIEKEFSIHGFGKVITGIPSSGDVKVGDTLRILPGDHVGRVRKVQVYGHESSVGRAGECVALNISDVHGNDITRGSVVVEGDAFESVSMFEGQIHILKSAKRPVKDFQEVHLHIGTSEAMANVIMLEGSPVEPGNQAMVQLRCNKPLPVALGERFIIRSTSAQGMLTTIGGGRICSVSNKKLKRKRSWLLKSLADFNESLDIPEKWVANHLMYAGVACGISQLSRIAQMREDDTKRLISDLENKKEVIAASGGRFIHQQVVSDAGKTISDALQEFHENNPMRGGLDPLKLGTSLDLTPEVFAAAAAQLVADGAIEYRGPLLAIAGAKANIDDADRHIIEKIEQILIENGLTPPNSVDIMAEVGCDQKKFDKLVQFLCDDGKAVKLHRKVIMHSESVDKARSAVLELFRKQTAFETVEFRDAIGVSRKFAIPLLDYFDTIRLTHRKGNRRTPGIEAKKAAE